MVHAGCVFVAGIHLSMTWMSRSSESMWWNACLHRLDLCLYSHPKEPMLTPRVKSPLPKKNSSSEDRTHNAALNKTMSPTHYQLSYSGPHFSLVKIEEKEVKFSRWGGLVGETLKHWDTETEKEREKRGVGGGGEESTVIGILHPGNQYSYLWAWRRV